MLLDTLDDRTGEEVRFSGPVVEVVVVVVVDAVLVVILFVVDFVVVSEQQLPPTVNVQSLVALP